MARLPRATPPSHAKTSPCSSPRALPPVPRLCSMAWVYCRPVRELAPGAVIVLLSVQVVIVLPRVIPLMNAEMPMPGSMAMAKKLLVPKSLKRLRTSLEAHLCTKNVTRLFRSQAGCLKQSPSSKHRRDEGVGKRQFRDAARLHLGGYDRTCLLAPMSSGRRRSRTGLSSFTLMLLVLIGVSSSSHSLIKASAKNSQPRVSLTRKVAMFSPGLLS